MYTLPKMDVKLAVISVFTLLVSFYLYNYWDISTGDPQIHLIFAKNFIEGYPLQFNQGEFTSGETSPVYMILVAALMLFFGDYTILPMKLIGVFSIIGIFFLILRTVALNAKASSGDKYIYAIPFLILPSTWFQALLGMENMLFAFLCLLIVHCWLNSGGVSKKLIYLVGLPLLFFLRPEAVLLYALLLFLTLTERDFKDAGLIILSGMATLTVFFVIQKITGVPLYSAGEARVYMSRLDSVYIDSIGLFINEKPIRACAYIAPFFLLMMLKLRSVISFREKMILFFLTVTPCVLHFFNVFPSTHFSRYFLYALVAFFYVFAGAASRVEDRHQIGNLTAYAILFLCLTVVPVEIYLRTGIVSHSYKAIISKMSKHEVERFSNDLYDSLGRPAPPVVLAVQEVQIRGYLDSRFVVRSLDGVVDNRLDEFLHPGWVDHVGYLNNRSVTYVMAYPDYNIDKTKFSLALVKDKEYYCSDNTIFTKLYLAKLKIHKVKRGMCAETAARS